VEFFKVAELNTKLFIDGTFKFLCLKSIFSSNDKIEINVRMRRETIITTCESLFFWQNCPFMGLNHKKYLKIDDNSQSLETLKLSFLATYDRRPLIRPLCLKIKIKLELMLIRNARHRH
jgi:hypothetical protein